MRSDEEHLRHIEAALLRSGARGIYYYKMFYQVYAPYVWAVVSSTNLFYLCNGIISHNRHYILPDTP